MMTTTLDKTLGVKTLEEACDTITKEMKTRGGDVTIKAAPRAVSEKDDRLLSQLMETLERQNCEVAGDDPEED